MEVRLNSNRAEVIAAKNRAVQMALEAIGIQAEAHTVANITADGLVDTGNMRNSISHYADDNTAYIGTPVEYAVYQELGTSRGVKAHHFLKRAITENKAQYQQIIERYLKG